MPYPTIQKTIAERASAAVFGAMTGLIAAGQDDAARYVVDHLDAQLLRDVHGLVTDHTDPVLVVWLRERVNAGAARAGLKAVPAGPDPVVDPDAEGPSTVQEKLRRALRTLLPSMLVKDVTSGDAYSVLVGYVAEACERDGVEPIVVLKRLGARKLAFVEHADNPAAYLARQVADYTPESVLEATAEERLH